MSKVSLIRSFLWLLLSPSISGKSKLILWLGLRTRCFATSDFVFRLVHVLESVWLDYGKFGQCMIVHKSNLVYTQLLHCAIGLDDL